STPRATRRSLRNRGISKRRHRLAMSRGRHHRARVRYTPHMETRLALPNLQHDVPIGPLTTYRIGGPATCFVEVTTADELTDVITIARESGIPWFLLGTGAN